MISLCCVERNIPIIWKTENGNASDKTLNNELLSAASSYMAKAGLSPGGSSISCPSPGSDRFFPLARPRTQVLHWAHDLLSDRLNVLIHSEEVRRVVFLLEFHQPVVHRSVGKRDAVGLVLGEEVNIRAAAGERL